MSESSSTQPVPLFSQLPAIGRLTGWRRNLAAFLCGVMATLALPPLYLVPLMVPAFCGLVWLLKGAGSRRRMFWDGWFWGWGFYMTGLYWFCIALLTDAESFAWLLPFALFGLTGVIALYQGIACWLMGYVRLKGISWTLAFALVWVLVEYARGHWFTGFPWNLAGYVLTVSDVSIQLASVGGIYGVTWLVVLLCMLPALLGDAEMDSKKAVRIVGRAYLLFIIALLWGAWRLHEAGETHFDDQIKLRLVQANIKQEHKWNPAQKMHGLEEHAKLTRTEDLGDIKLIIWPETAVPYILKEHTPLAHALGSLLPAHTLLITGAMRAEGNEVDWKIWNSMAVIDAKGEIVKSYDKSRLVPFGEFLPFRFLLPEWMTTPVGDKDFSTGRRGVTLEIPDEQHAMLPLICYEGIFPEMAEADPSFAPPTWMLNITNDAWFGTSSAPYQHLEMSRMRAVERGIPLVRVANTGISAVIDSVGRVVAKTKLNEETVLDSPLPLPEKASTLYSRFSDEAVLFLILLFSAILGIKPILQNRKGIYS